MPSSDINSKSLLSQNEVEALLSIFNDREEENPDVLFELTMAKVARNIGNYLERLGLSFDAVQVVKKDENSPLCYSYDVGHKQLKRLFLQNTLVNAIIARQCGAKKQDLTLQRELSDLEEVLLQEVSEQIVYMVEKELEGYFERHEVSASLDDYRIALLKDETMQLLYFSFQQEKKDPEKAEVPQRREGTKVEILMGELLVEALDEGRFYELQNYIPKRLLLDGALLFETQRLASEGEIFSYVLGEAAQECDNKARYYVVIARGYLEDEKLLKLKRGSLVSVQPLEQIEICKDGKIRAVAELYSKENRIAVKVRSIHVQK